MNGLFPLPVYESAHMNIKMLLILIFVVFTSYTKGTADSGENILAR
jgi:hypothetical protein